MNKIEAYFWNIVDPAVTWDGDAVKGPNVRAKIPLWRRILFGEGA